MKYLAPLLAVFAGLLVGALVLKISGISPIEAYQVMWAGAFSKPQYLAYIIIRSTPIILTGLSVAFAFRTGLFNIGTEGQFIIGALTAAFFGYKCNFAPVIQIPLVILLSIICSGLYGGIAGLLKARFGIHEVISSIMLNWIALYYSNYAVMMDGFHRPNTETSEFISPSTSITFFEDTKPLENFWADFFRPPVNAGIFIALILIVLIWIVLNKTTFGFKLKAVGFNSEASKYAGINVKKKMTQSMMIAGALSGLAGALHVMGVSKNIAILAAHEGYGFDGIAVSLIGSNHPFGTLIAGLFLGTLKYSGQKIQSALEAPSEIILIMIGAIIFFIAIPNLWRKKS